MSPADVIALRVPHHLRPRSKRRPKPGTGEIELFRKLGTWHIPHEYESVFFPLEFHPKNQQVREGFQPDARIFETRRYPEYFIEIGLGGWSRAQRTIVNYDAFKRTQREKRRRIQKLFDYYDIRTLLIDGPLYDEIVNRSDGRQRFCAAVDELFASAPDMALAA